MLTGGLALSETISWGILYYAFSVFLVPMQRELGWTTATLTGAYSLALLVAGFAAPFVGRVVDRRGPRLLMTLGSGLGVVLLVVWSRVSDLAVYYGLWAGMGLAMSATLYEPAFTTIANWFHRDRPRALLLLTIVAGFASTIFLPLSSWLVETRGWRDALLLLAALLGLTTIPIHALILRRRPEDLGLRVDGAAGAAADSPSVDDPAPGWTLKDALRDRVFWWLTIGFFLGTLSTVAVGVYLIPFLVDAGYALGFAAVATGLIGALQVVARIIVTFSGQRWNPATLTAAVFALQAVAIVVLLIWQQAAGVLTAVILLGAGRGAVTLMRPTLVAERYGRRNFGVIGGALAMFVSGAGALAPIGAGLAYGATGAYRPVFFGLAGASLLAAVALFAGVAWRK